MNYHSGWRDRDTEAERQASGSGLPMHFDAQA